MLYRLEKDAVVFNHGHPGKDEALEEIIRLVCDVYDLDIFDEVYRLISERENKLSTGIGLGIAIPHCRINAVRNIIAGVMLLTEGIEYNSVDGNPVKLIVLIVSPTSDIRGHLACLSAISGAVSDEQTRLKLIHSASPDELYENVLQHIQ